MRFLATEDKVKITGRTLFRDDVRYLSYSGSSITFTFTGKKAQIAIWTDGEKWDSTLKGWAAVYINDATEPSMRFQFIEPESVYTVFESEIEETVTVSLVKYSEAAFGKCGVKYIEIDTDKLLAPPKALDRRIEIIGDSITCGYGVEAKNELESFDTTIENPAKAYSLKMAKLLNSEINLVSWSGIGIISRYVDESVNEPLDDWLMPMLYKYTDASCSKEVFEEEEKDWEVWDNSKYVPDIILINIGTNDASYCREIPKRNEVYIKEYIEFLKEVRGLNPTPEILCMLGTMDQRLCDSLKTAYERYVESEKDKHIHYFHLPMQLDEDGRGADYHPSAITQQKSAEMIAAEVARIMEW